jgi:hypothetical protein
MGVRTRPRSVRRVDPGQNSAPVHHSLRSRCPSDSPTCCRKCAMPARSCTCLRCAQRRRAGSLRRHPGQRRCRQRHRGDFLMALENSEFHLGRLSGLQFGHQLHTPYRLRHRLILIRRAQNLPKPEQTPQVRMFSNRRSTSLCGANVTVAVVTPWLRSC